jgi:NAD(P)-dependent dehydrogenase (short-subunit alcohol dehydrogenase family)/acyl carrier protein
MPPKPPPGDRMGRFVVVDEAGSALPGYLRTAGGRHETCAGLVELAQAIDAGASPPEAVLVDGAFGAYEAVAGEDLTCISQELAGVAHALAGRALALIHAWIDDERFSRSRLVFVTREALAAGTADSVSGLAQSPLWGLVRSAQSEHPERFVLIDIDGERSSARALPSALASGEPQIALRAGRALIPRVVPAGAPTVANASAAGAPTDGGARFDPERTVLITGGTGALGALIARRLVEAHGVPSVLLASRRGRDAEGAVELEAELAALGASVSIVACDVADREQVRALLGSVPEEYPLGGIVHAAGVLDDGVVHALTPERIDRVLAPKVDAASHLHELTEQMDLGAFVLFSSVAATLGAAGQGNYAAANAYLDALAGYRRARGLAAVSVAWGPWAAIDGMMQTLNASERSRMGRSGLRTLSDRQGLELFEAACASGEPTPIATVLDRGELRLQAKVGGLPVLLAGLIRTPPRNARIDRDGSRHERLANMEEPERSRVALELTLAHVAAVLGHLSPAAIDPKQTFKELGFDSLIAVELRNRLSAETRLRLPATLVFDHPTAEAVSRHIVAELGRGGTAPGASIEQELDEFERRLFSIAEQEAHRSNVTSRLKALLSELGAEQAEGPDDEDVRSATAEEVFALIDREVGSV